MKINRNQLTDKNLEALLNSNYRLDDGFIAKVIECLGKNSRAVCRRNGSGIAKQGEVDKFIKVKVGKSTDYKSAEVKCNEGNACTEEAYRKVDFVCIVNYDVECLHKAMTLEDCYRLVESLEMYAIPTETFLEYVPRKTYGKSKEGFGIAWRKSKRNAEGKWELSVKYEILQSYGTEVNPDDLYVPDDFYID